MISNKAKLGSNVKLGLNTIIEDDVIVGDNVVVDNNVIIRNGSRIGESVYIGANCIIGEYSDPSRIIISNVILGNSSVIRSGCKIYNDSVIGENFSSGHNVTIREGSKIGKNVSIGTLSDIQGNCYIGNYVRLHSNVHVGQLSRIDDYSWIFPYVVLTNDPKPPSDNLLGVHIESFAVVATASVLLPGIIVGQDSLVGAGSIVTKNVNKYEVVVGNPARYVCDIREIKDKIDNKEIYPWRNHFSSYMPWEGSTFSSWYENLSSKDKEEFNLTGLQIDK